MEFRLNLFLKNFGNNSTPSLTFFCKDEKEIKHLIENYKPVLRNWEAYKYEYEDKNNIHITKRTDIKKIDILSLLPESDETFKRNTI